MIHFNCPSCGQKYNVPADKAGVKAKCKKCGGVMTVPEPAEDAAIGVGDFHGTAPRQAPGPHAAASADPELDALAAANLADDTGDIPRPKRRPHSADKLPGRPYSGAEEIAVRRRNLVIVGILLIVAFIMPSCAPSGRGGSEIVILNIQGLFEGRVPIALKVLLLHPLLAGIVCCLAHLFTPLVRGWINIGMGILPIVLVFLAVPDQVRDSLGETLSGTGGAEGAIGFVLTVASFYGIFIGCRLRWYRPEMTGAYVGAAIGAVAGLIMLVLPDARTGDIGLIAPFKVMEIDGVIGFGSLLWVAAMIAAAVVALLNTPGRPLAQASVRANIAFWIYMGGLIAVFTLVALRSMGMGMGAEMAMVIGIMIKFGIWFGATAMLVPMGVIDAVLGEPVAGAGLCAACGYDLRGVAGRSCPECGHVA